MLCNFDWTYMAVHIFCPDWWLIQKWVHHRRFNWNRTTILLPWKIASGFVSKSNYWFRIVDALTCWLIYWFQKITDALKMDNNVHVHHGGNLLLKIVYCISSSLEVWSDDRRLIAFSHFGQQATIFYLYAHFIVMHLLNWCLPHKFSPFKCQCATYKLHLYSQTFTNYPQTKMYIQNTSTWSTLFWLMHLLWKLC